MITDTNIISHSDNPNLFTENLFTDFDKVKPIHFSENNDVVEVCEVAGKNPGKSKRCMYLENDVIENIDEVLKRWNVRKLANINRNFSCSNFKLRLYKNNTPIPPKRFRQNLFVGEELSEQAGQNQQDRVNAVKTIMSDEDMAKVNKDAEALIARKRALRAETDKLKERLKDIHNSTVNNLKTLIRDQHSSMNIAFVKDTLKKLACVYGDKLTEVESALNEEVTALTSLFNSRNYELGKLGEYRKLETYQPSARRMKYDDDGRRVMILPMNTIKNILIEDEIYNFYYGFPTN
jgi:hypothetical protein